jgi:hypothetical protein
MSINDSKMRLHRKQTYYEESRKEAMRPPSALSKFAKYNKVSNFSDVQSTSAATNKVNRGLGYEYTDRSPRLPGIKSFSNKVNFGSEESKYGGSPKESHDHDHQLHVARTAGHRSKKHMPTYDEQ